MINNISSRYDLPGFSKVFDMVCSCIIYVKMFFSFNFLNNRQHCVSIPGGINLPHPVLSGVPTGTVIGPLLFLIMIIDIDKGISPSF